MLLRRSFLAFLNLAPLSFAAKWFPGSTIAAKGDLFRHKGWLITWTAYSNSTTSLGYWMGVPVSNAALKRKNNAALRVLVPLGNDKTKLIGLKRLDYLIASDWKPVAGVAMQASPFQRPSTIAENAAFLDRIKAGYGRERLDLDSRVFRATLPEDPKDREERERKESERDELSTKMIGRGDFEGAAAIMGIDPKALRDFWHPQTSGSGR